MSSDTADTAECLGGRAAAAPDCRLPAEAGFAMPPEWRRHAGCLMAWPCRDSAHRGFLQQARANYAALARAIGEFEPVQMICRPQDEAAARKLLGAHIETLPLPIDDAWMRDSGPTYVAHKSSGEVAGVDWLFNAWGGKYQPHEADDAVAGKILRWQNKRRFLAPLVLEGGSFHVNGAGVIMTTEQCLLHKNRNPRLQKDDIEILLRAYLGGHQVLWLAGDARDDETDGHVDNIACFAEADVILLMNDDGDAMLQENKRRARQSKTRAGGAYQIVELPRPCVQENGADLLASYVNFYFANDAVIMPAFNRPEDAAARAILAEVFPRRKIVALPATDIVRGGGGIHCVTQQIPAEG